MAKLELINGVMRMKAEAGDLPAPYDDYFDVVDSGASGENERNVADCTAGTPITLPNSGSYEGHELKIELNGISLDDIIDFTWVGSGVKTQIAFTFDLVTGDRIRVWKDRNA